MLALVIDKVQTSLHFNQWIDCIIGKILEKQYKLEQFITTAFIT